MKNFLGDKELIEIKIAWIQRHTEKREFYHFDFFTCKCHLLINLADNLDPDQAVLKDDCPAV